VTNHFQVQKNESLEGSGNWALVDYASIILSIIGVFCENYAGILGTLSHLNGNKASLQNEL